MARRAIWGRLRAWRVTGFLRSTVSAISLLGRDFREQRKRERRCMSQRNEAPIAERVQDFAAREEQDFAAFEIIIGRGLDLADAAGVEIPALREPVSAARVPVRDGLPGCGGGTDLLEQFALRRGERIFALIDPPTRKRQADAAHPVSVLTQDEKPP